MLADTFYRKTFLYSLFPQENCLSPFFPSSLRRSSDFAQRHHPVSWLAWLKGIMEGIFHACDDASKKYGMEGNYVAGANIAGFEKVADAMIAQGIAY